MGEVGREEGRSLGLSDKERFLFLERGVYFIIYIFLNSDLFYV